MKSTKLLDLIFEDQIITNLSVINKEQAINILGDLLIIKKFIKQEYILDVIRREAIFPTGLPTKPHGVAIPHADPDNVLRTSISIGILKHPISFREMGLPESSGLEISIIFLLAIKERESQTQLIKDIINLIQSDNLLKKLLHCSNSKSVYDEIKRIYI